MIKRNMVLKFLIVIFSIMISFASVDTIINQLNSDIEKRFNFSNYFLTHMQTGDFNESAYLKYHVPVYGKPHGDYKNVDGVMEPRFIGYADNGESVPNPVFPPDEVDSTLRVKLPWIKDPWSDPRVRSVPKFDNVRKSFFDKSRLQFKSVFLLSMQRMYGNNGVVKKSV